MDEKTESRIGQEIYIIVTLINGRVRGLNPAFTVASCVIVGL